MSAEVKRKLTKIKDLTSEQIGLAISETYELLTECQQNLLNLKIELRNRQIAKPKAKAKAKTKK